MGYTYGPRNGPLHSIEELLLVRDVTPALLFGADLNRDCVVQPLEQALLDIENADNSTGELDRGWSAYLTLDSAERNVRPDGRLKINVNMEDLALLHEQLLEFLPEAMANFIIAFRQGGAYTSTTTGSTETAESPESITLDFTQPGRERLTTILDLIGVRTRIARPLGAGGQGGGAQGGQGGQGGQESRIVVEAAFAEDPAAMQEYLPLLMQNLAVNAAPILPARLNINQAPRRLLMGIPGIDPALVDQIIASRDVLQSGEVPEQAHETWLLSQGMVNLESMKTLLPLITAGGDVYRARVVGYYDADGPLARLEVVIDATRRPPIILRRWELEKLGQDAGYTPAELGAEGEGTL
jgi:DNA uptake protein ComE-like DNA-binding protein